MIATSMPPNEEAVFVDTGYFVALESLKDAYHSVALQHWNAMSRRLPSLITTSYIFDEVVTFFNSRGYHDKAKQLGDLLLTSSYIDVVHVDEPLFLSAWEYMRRHRDKEYSLTDCVSFLVMQERGLSTAFAFDRHFLQAGFKIVP